MSLISTLFPNPFIFLFACTVSEKDRRARLVVGIGMYDREALEKALPCFPKDTRITGEKGELFIRLYGKKLKTSMIGY
ncbi:MAG: hypothetical protein ACUVTD_02365 [Nitrososphaerales archaeon]